MSDFFSSSEEEEEKPKKIKRNRNGQAIQSYFNDEADDADSDEDDDLRNSSALEANLREADVFFYYKKLGKSQKKT